MLRYHHVSPRGVSEQRSFDVRHQCRLMSVAQDVGIDTAGAMRQKRCDPALQRGAVMHFDPRGVFGGKPPRALGQCRGWIRPDQGEKPIADTSQEVQLRAAKDEFSVPGQVQAVLSASDRRRARGEPLRLPSR